MGGFVSSLENSFGGGSGPNAGGDLSTSFGLPSNFGQSITNLGNGIGSSIAKIGNASSGVIPQGTQAPTNVIPMPQVRPGQAPLQAPPSVIQGAVNNAQNPVALQSSPMPTSTVSPVASTPYSLPAGVTFPANNPGGPNAGAAASPGGVSPGTVPMANGVPIGSIKGGDNNSIYGDDTGTAITNLYNQEGSGAGSTAQAIIAANAPNVAQGSANLNAELAASGISPSSSVSAIENANYESGVQQQNVSEEAQVALEDQQMQQQLLENLLPSEQQRQTDSSGWSIFGDVMQGVGDVAGAALML